MKEKYTRFFSESVSKPPWNKILAIVGKSDRGNPREGWAYVINGTFDNMNLGMDPQKAFVQACDNENYYGTRSDIVRERKGIADVLKRHFKIIVDPVEGF